MKRKNMYLIVMIVSIIGAFIALMFLFALNADAGGRKKTKIRYKCWNSSGERVVCPEGFKQSPGYKAYLRRKKARKHDTSRQYYTDEDREDNRERTYIDESPRTYYDDSIREEAND
jgi:hypothetical protein